MSEVDGKTSEHTIVCYSEMRMQHMKKRKELTKDRDKTAVYHRLEKDGKPSNSHVVVVRVICAGRWEELHFAMRPATKYNAGYRLPCQFRPPTASFRTPFAFVIIKTIIIILASPRA